MATDELVDASLQKLLVRVEQLLLRQSNTMTQPPTNLFYSLKRSCESEGLNWNPAGVLEHWAQLERIGAVAVSPVPDTAHNHQIVGWLLTEKGRRLLEKAERSPHFPARYRSALRGEIGTGDDIVLSYVSEALEAWASGLARASVVMLGCASERLVVLLAESVAGAGLAPWSSRIEKALRSDRPVSISGLFDDVQSALEQLAASGQLAAPLAAALKRTLTSIFDRARGLRNRAGHPTGELVTLQDAEAGLLLFPDFYRFVVRLMEALQSRTTSGA